MDCIDMTTTHRARPPPIVMHAVVADAIAAIQHSHMVLTPAHRRAITALVDRLESDASLRVCDVMDEFHAHLANSQLVDGKKGAIVYFIETVIARVPRVHDLRTIVSPASSVPPPWSPSPIGSDCDVISTLPGDMWREIMDALHASGDVDARLALSALACTSRAAHARVRVWRDEMHDRRRRTGDHGPRMSVTFARRMVERALELRNTGVIGAALAAFRVARTREFNSFIDDRIEIHAARGHKFTTVDTTGVWRMMRRQFPAAINPTTRTLLEIAACWCIAPFTARVIEEDASMTRASLEAMTRSECEADDAAVVSAWCGSSSDASVSQVVGALAEGQITQQWFEARGAQPFFTRRIRYQDMPVEMLLVPSIPVFDAHAREVYIVRLHIRHNIARITVEADALSFEQLEQAHARILYTLRKFNVLLVYNTPRDFRAAYANAPAAVARAHIIETAATLQYEMHNIWLHHTRFVQTSRTQHEFAAYVYTVVPSIRALAGGNWDMAYRVLVDTVATVDDWSMSELVAYTLEHTKGGKSVHEWLDFRPTGPTAFPPLHFFAIALKIAYEIWSVTLTSREGASINIVPFLRQMWDRHRSAADSDTIERSIKTIAVGYPNHAILAAYRRIESLWDVFERAAGEYLTASPTFPRTISDETVAQLLYKASWSREISMELGRAVQLFLERGICNNNTGLMMLRFTKMMFNERYPLTGVVGDFIRAMDTQLTEHDRRGFVFHSSIPHAPNILWDYITSGTVSYYQPYQV